MNEYNLPRLLYIGDVPIEPAPGGSMLIFRLLQNYPTSHLKIIQSNIYPSSLEKRLSGVSYEVINLSSRRLLSGIRFGSIYWLYLILTSQFYTSQVIKAIGRFKPEAILTVAHGLSWLRAAALAEQLNLPLHLIVHDDWSFNNSPLIRKIIDRQFGFVYKKARSRLCISPYMVECYEKKYGVTGQVVYPSRAIDTAVFDQPRKPDSFPSAPLTFAYAGSVHQRGYAENLCSLASVLETLGANLVIYSLITEEAIQKMGLNRPNVTVYTPIPSQHLIQTLRDKADVLFVPMSFETGDRPNMEISFPSKLTDYTATGLPLLIWGPPYCSAVRWAKENSGVAEVVDKEDIQALECAVKKLIHEPEYRFYLSIQALKKGDEYFSQTNAVHKFYQSLVA